MSRRPPHLARRPAALSREWAGRANCPVEGSASGTAEAASIKRRLPQGSPRKTFLNFRNNLTMLYKNLSDSELPGVMRMRFVLDWVAAFQMLILGRSWGDFRAVVRARRDFKRWKKDFAADRERIQSTRMLPTGCVNGVYSFSILWQYYIKGIRKFSDLKF